jgi:integrase
MFSMIEILPDTNSLPGVSTSYTPSLARSAAEFAAASRATSTIKAYRNDWQSFCGWCGDQGIDSLPAAPATVAAYLASLAASHKPATMSKKLAAISSAHKLAGVPNPCGSEAVRLTFAGIRRTMGTRQRQVKPLTVEDLRKVIINLPDDKAGIRDRALLLLGFGAALRRSELVALTVEDLDFTDQGLVITVVKSKTDQEGEGRQIGVPYGSSPDTCAVKALQTWLEAAGVTDGPVFRKVDRHGHVGLAALTPQAVALIVKRSVEAVGLDPEAYSGHSLRSGLATSAAERGASEAVIASTTGHKSSAMVRRYIRSASLFKQNAASVAGL